MSIYKSVKIQKKMNTLTIVRVLGGVGDLI